MSTLTIRIPDRLKSELSARAKASGKSVPQLVRDLLDRQFLASGQAASLSLYDRSRDLCGSVRGTPADLARNRKHLAGYGAWKR
jgi:plasmid stability protein